MSEDSLEARLRSWRSPADQQADTVRKEREARDARWAQEDALGQRHIDEFLATMRKNNVPAVPVYGSSYTTAGIHNNLRTYRFWNLGITGWLLNDDLNPFREGSFCWQAVLSDRRVIRVKPGGNPHYPRKLKVNGIRGRVDIQQFLCSKDPLEIEFPRVCQHPDIMTEAAYQCLRAKSGIWSYQ